MHASGAQQDQSDQMSRIKTVDEPLGQTDILFQRQAGQHDGGEAEHAQGEGLSKEGIPAALKRPPVHKGERSGKTGRRMLAEEVEQQHQVNAMDAVIKLAGHAEAQQVYAGGKRPAGGCGLD